MDMIQLYSCKFEVKGNLCLFHIFLHFRKHSKVLLSFYESFHINETKVKVGLFPESGMEAGK